MPIQWNGPPPPGYNTETAQDYFKNLDLDNRQSSKQERKAALRKARGLTIKGKIADEDQRTNMEVVITTARATKGSRKMSVLAVIVAVIQESLCRNLKGGDGTSSGILQVITSTALSHGIDPRDIEACVKEFMNVGFYNYGGANDLARKHRSYSPGDIAWRVQGPREDLRGEYSRWEEEARRWLEAAEGGLIEGGPNTYRKPYRFERRKDENNWDAMQRLAHEVNWKCFPVGRVMYYMSETDLFRRRIAYVITPEDESLLDFTYDIDWRAKVPVNEGILTVNLDRWGAPPGYPIQLEGFGPPDGRWLIISVRRDWFSPTAEVTIRQPIVPLKEPANEVVTKQATGAENDGSGMNLYRACRKIHKARPTYLLGGQHGIPLSHFVLSRAMDCSSSTSKALHMAGLWDGRAVARPSWEFDDWGRGGRGNIFTVCYRGDHVYIRFEPGALVDARRFDTSAWGGDNEGRGPRLRFTEGPPGDDTYSLRHWPDM